VIVSAANRRLSRRARDGFTLMEVLVVVAILVILASIATFSVLRYLDDAKIDRARMDMRTIHTQVKAYHIRSSQWPTSLMSLVQPEDGGRPFLEGGAQALMDPWGNQYQYTMRANPTSGEEEPVIFTTGPQGQQLMWPQN
jgi:general secretion pathway protein G